MMNFNLAARKVSTQSRSLVGRSLLSNQCRRFVRTTPARTLAPPVTTNTSVGAFALCSSAALLSCIAVSKSEPDVDRAAKCGASSPGMPTVEPKTGISFPYLCDGLTFVGTGVRVKYGFVKVYAVGTYVDPNSMAGVKGNGEKAITDALLNPTVPKTIRIVMNRSLSIDKYTAAIVEALEPRMKGVDLEKLEEFKKLNPPGDLVEGSEMIMTIRGDHMMYRTSMGSLGVIRSEVFCRAMCDV
mmetsp:Transcript_26597/g.61221  ORF Transcript_26597/g.61221 Transcript_26597/m.61221 type:complete len:242 (-) Transcript_26597:326-1051(-)